VAPRYGFRSAEHYYAEASVAPRLGSLARPALLVAALDDPMIPPEVLRPALSQEYPLLDVRWLEQGGHVGFPDTIDLGLGGELGLEAQALRWLRKAGAL
jgi:predicted alpha/beta-fold hydrolase